jgi:hypothetical protein
MYALEFSPEELCDEPAAEEPEVEYDCPACHAPSCNMRCITA